MSTLNGKSGIMTDTMYNMYNVPQMPVMDVNSWDMTCRSTNMAKAPRPLEIDSNDILVLNFDPNQTPAIISEEQASQHIWGPCIVYMANADTVGKELKWFKVFEYSGDKDAWCSQKIISNGGKLHVPMKPKLKSGKYI
ncbi:hypothetical protein GGI18_005744, partial [Coemansia linderi]